MQKLQSDLVTSFKTILLLELFIEFATVVLLSNIFKSIGKKPAKACFIVLILQLSVIVTFCFLTPMIKMSLRKQAPYFLAYTFRMSDANF